MYVEIYSRDGCVYCDMAIELTTQLPTCTYDKYTLNKDFTREEMVSRFPTATTYPQILVDGEHIGGYTEYNEYVGRMDRVRHHPTDSH